VWGWFSSQQAEAQRKQELKISVEQKNVDLVIKLLPAFAAEVGAPERVNAVAVMVALEKEGNLSPELRATLDRGRSQVNEEYDPERGFRTAGARRESEAYASRDGAAPSGGATVQVASLPGAQVYIQIFAETQRDTAEAARQAIRNAGVGAPGIENVVNTAEKKNRPPPKGDNQMKLLVFQESAGPIAKRVADAVKKSTGQDVIIDDRWKNKSNANVPLGQLELWFPSAG
jgi:hypothetical protein